MSNNSLDQHLAQIVGNTRRKRRVISIPELATSIEKASKTLGGIGPLSERIILSPTMLRQFLAVQDLHPKVRKMFANRVLDSVDLCSQLATLNSADQIFLAERAASGALQTKDVRDYREMRKMDASTAPEQLVEKIVASKPRLEFLAEFVLRADETVDGVRVQFLKYLKSDDILSINADGSIATLILSQKGRDRLRDLGRVASFTLEQTIQMVASGRL